MNKLDNILDLKSVGGFYLELEIEDILQDIHNLYLLHHDVDLSSLIFKSNSRFPVDRNELGKKAFNTVIKYLDRKNLEDRDVKVLREIDFFNNYTSEPIRGFLYSQEFMRLLLIKLYTLNNDNIEYIVDDFNNFNYKEVIEKYIDIDHYILDILINDFNKDARRVYEYILYLFNYIKVNGHNLKGYLLEYDVTDKVSIFTTENILYNYLIDLEDKYESLKNELKALKGKKVSS